MREVVVGFFSFTEVPAHAHRSYNEWHQLDHLPEQYAIDGIAHGERWVATPACVAARRADDDLLGRAQYVTLYLLTEPLDATLREFRELAVDLRALGRFHAERESLLSGPWRVAAKAVASRVLVSAAVVPWRPATGVYVVVEDGAASALDVDALVAVEGVAGCWTFERDESPRRIAVVWLDGDPVATAGALAPSLAGRPLVHAGPYEAIVPGRWDWFDA